jgi:3-methyl-2-oxobutanoate hydroxymethyltransferase
MPSELGRELTEALSVPVIGIGAGPHCSGQVLVLQDMLGITRGKQPRFVRNFMAEGGSIDDAVRRYVDAVRTGQFPIEPTHTY